MKKISKKQRQRDIKLGLDTRRVNKRRIIKKNNNTFSANALSANNWIDKHSNEGLNISLNRKYRVTIYLPEKMNFYEEYDVTILQVLAIRKLAETKRTPRNHNSYRLASVNFDNLKSISTSAALVLTAELSKWDDALRQKLRPKVNNWDKEILNKFTDLGFFDLFQNPPLETLLSHKPADVKLVQYIKGKCGDSKKTRVLREKLTTIVGDEISKWTFLRCGLDEAITNVSHHAYPDDKKFAENDKNWYLTGSFNNQSKEIKIVFYDQGIGIPKSLPTSEVWEKALDFLSKIKIPIADRKKDEVLLRAAIQLDRTSTEETDRGKGLQDLLEFIRHQKNGYLSILSLKGLFKLTIDNGKETIKTEHFDNGVCGTLIIWSAILGD